MAMEFNHKKLEKLQDELDRQRGLYHKLSESRNEVLADIRKKQQWLKGYNHNGAEIEEAEKEINILKAKREDLEARYRKVEDQLQRGGALLNSCLEWLRAKGVNL